MVGKDSLPRVETVGTEDVLLSELFWVPVPVVVTVVTVAVVTVVGVVVAFETRVEDGCY